jgi:hypothetical protein
MVNGAAGRRGRAGEPGTQLTVSGAPVIGVTAGFMATYLQKVVGFGSR